MKKVFDFHGKFGRVHHGYLNDLSKLDSLASHCDKHDGFVEIAEGDLCWYEKEGEVLLYFKHPEGLFRIPDIGMVKRNLESGNLHSLEAVFNKKYRKLRFIIEIKKGHGNPDVVFSRLVRLLEENLKDRYWIDGFDPVKLKAIHAISPYVPVSFHTRLGVYGPIFIRTSFEFPFFQLRRLTKQYFADIITISYKYSPVKIFNGFGRDINTFHRYVFTSGKKLVFGGVDNAELYDEIMATKAVAAYMKYNKVKFTLPFEPEDQDVKK